MYTLIEISSFLNNSELKGIIDGSTRSSLNLKIVDGIYCDVHPNLTRPYVPKSMRKRVFQNIHNLAHPGIKGSQREVSQRFVWPYLKRDVKKWAQCCNQCQTSKIYRHNKTSIVSISNDTSKFASIHLDIVGPLPPNKGFSYLLTVIDRFTRWPEAIPIVDTTAETVADSLIYNWIAKYGVPESISTDRGSCFESRLFNQLLKTLGCKHQRTCAYHPQSNGLIERFHKTLKSALRSKSPHDWIKKLPLVLLGLRTAFKSELGCSSAEAMYDCTLRLPVDLLRNSQRELELNIGSYVERLKSVMREFPKPVTRNYSSSSYIDPRLALATHVFVKHDAKKGLEPCYRGPFKILDRKEKYYLIDINSKPDSVSIDRLKSAHLDLEYPNNEPDSYITVTRTLRNDNELENLVDSNSPQLDQESSMDGNIEIQSGNDSPNPNNTVTTNKRSVTISVPASRTRSGRVVKPPSRYSPL